MRICYYGGCLQNIARWGSRFSDNNAEHVSPNGCPGKGKGGSMITGQRDAIAMAAYNFTSFICYNSNNKLHL